MGTFNPFTNSFSANDEAKHLNSTRDDLHLTIDPTGLWAIFERNDGVYVASRAKTATKFAAPRKVSGFGTLRDVHPSLGPVSGKMRCFYTDKTKILMQEIDLANAKLLGAAVIVSKALQTNAKPFAPTPVVGADGDVEGLWLSEEVTAKDSDMLWAADLDPNTPPAMVIQRKDWTNNGGVAGGFLSFAHDILPRWHIMHSESAWMLGDVEKIGGTADLTIAGVNFSMPTPLVSAIFFSLALKPGIKIAGIGGKLGLDLATLGVLGTVTHKDLWGVTNFSFRIPNVTGLKGLKLALQSLVINTVKSSLTFSSTATLSIK